MKMYDYYTPNDIKLRHSVTNLSFFGGEPKTVSPDTEKISVCEPDGEFSFLHEAAIIGFKGTLYASWYHNRERELVGYTPICGKRSHDMGKTWSDREIIADDKSGKLLYCPPVYHIGGGKLYMFVNEMVGPDLIHSLDLYVLSEETDKFELLWSRPVPFKINTNVITLPNGKLMIPGRIAKLDGFPNTPAVLISDSGNAEGEWRVVKLAENGDLPNGEKLVHPETTAIVNKGKIYVFNRNDSGFAPLAYISEDFGETWSGVMCHDIPYINSKIYAGTLSDGRNYLIANEYIKEHIRSRLVMYLTDTADMLFEKRIVLADEPLDAKHGELCQCHYPAACEYGGKLYIIATEDYKNAGRRAVMFAVDISKI